MVRAILADKSGGFAALAPTRDPGSDKAKALADLGAEVVQADLHDPASVKRAFDGAYGAYCMTFFWAHMSPDTELQEARSMAEAARAARLQHVTWPTLEDTRKSVPLSDDRMPTSISLARRSQPRCRGRSASRWKYNQVPFEVFRNLGFPGADDLGNMFQFYAEFEKQLSDTRDLAKTRALNPELQTFDQWLARNKERIPLA